MSASRFPDPIRPSLSARFGLWLARRALRKAKKRRAAKAARHARREAVRRHGPYALRAEPEPEAPANLPLAFMAAVEIKRAAERARAERWEDAEYRRTLALTLDDLRPLYPGESDAALWERLSALKVRARHRPVQPPKESEP